MPQIMEEIEELIVDSSATDHERNRRGADRGSQCHRSWRKLGRCSAGPRSRSLWRFFRRFGGLTGFLGLFRAPPVVPE